MPKSSIIKCLLSLMLMMYLVFALVLTSSVAAHDTCAGLVINVEDSTKRNFVTAEDIALELGAFSENIRNITFDSINTYALEQRIMAKDNIEKAHCHVLNNRTLRIDVTPLIPLARVFDTHGENYYINRAGKKIDASLRYRMDVPVVVGQFDGRVTPSLAFPLLDYLDSHPELADLTSAIEVKRNKDLILVPKIKGHVVNIGDTNDLDNKFARVRTFYRKVMPLKGWEYYDTISVKYRGQVVATIRNAKTPDHHIPVEEHSDIDDLETMMAPNTQQTAN